MYIPKNRAITNLNTTPGEFVYRANNEPYEGVYWKDYKGKYWTGKNPNIKPTYELIKVIPYENYTNPNKPTSRIALVDAPELDANTEENWNEEMVIQYARIKNENLVNPTVLNLPSMYYPQPTTDDYKLGEFRRYFCVKTNQNIYLEIDKNTYKKLKTHDVSWLSEYYKTFYLDWVITGNEQEVKNTNKDLTILKEHRLKRSGLAKFLRRNFIKFYKDLDFESSTIPQDTISPPSEPQNNGNNY